MNVAIIVVIVFITILMSTVISDKYTPVFMCVCGGATRFRDYLVVQLLKYLDSRPKNLHSPPSTLFNRY